MFPKSQAQLGQMSLKQKTAIVIALMQFPALTVMLFLRQKIGFRQLKQSWLTSMTLLLLLLAYLGGGSVSSLSPFGGRSGSSYSLALVLFALVMLGTGIFQRRMRWSDLCNGVRLHTRARGISYLSRLFPFSELSVQRFVDPAACFIVGLILLKFTQPLGMWLMFSGIALYIVEQYVYEMQLEEQLDIYDGLIDAEVQSESVQHFDGPQPVQKERTLEQTAGIPTGVSPALEVQIAKRKKRVLPPDNLAVAS